MILGSIIFMLTTFIIQIEASDAYPFDGPKPSHIQPLVRVEYLSKDRQVLLDLGRKIARLLRLRCSVNMRATRVKEVKRKGYVIDY